jgi:hypothetical protein
MFPAVMVQQPFTFKAEFRFQAALRIVNTGMDNFTVSAAGLLSESGMLLSQVDITEILRQSGGYGKTDNACSDNCYLCIHSDNNLFIHRKSNH